MDVVTPVTFLTTLILHHIPVVDSIGCFVCSSINNSEPRCEDVFNNTGNFYEQRCFAGRKGHAGIFPGTHCIKLKGQMSATGVTYMVRACTVDGGGTHSGTEIGRSNHCDVISLIKFDDASMKGCLMSCKTDGCNGASRNRNQNQTIISISLLVCLTTLFGYHVS